MTISLLLVVTRILTVTTRSRLEMLPVSGAPAAPLAWGRHRLALPAFPPAPATHPSTAGAGSASGPHPATWEGAGGLAEQEKGFCLSPATLGAQHPAPGTAAWWGEPRGGRRGGPRWLRSYPRTSCRFPRKARAAGGICQLSGWQLTDEPMLQCHFLNRKDLAKTKTKMPEDQ